MSGIFTAARPLTVSSPAIPQVGGEPALVPLKLSGVEAVNSLFEYTLTLQTPDALNYMGRSGTNFDLKSFIGRELTCSIELEGHGQFVAGVVGGSAANQGAGVREISGIITGAKLLGEDDRHALYELTLRPWLHLATLTTDCKVFQDMTPVEIIESVLSDYAFVAEKRLIERYPMRDYTVQYNETDFEFVTRLMQEWGISYRFSHGGGIHRLIWSDHNGAFQVTQEDHDKGVSAYHEIPYYPPGHKTDREYIHGFSLTHRLTSGSYATRDYDYTRPRATLDVREAAPRSTGHADAEVYVWRGDKHNIGGSDYSQPNRGADKAANQTESQGSHLARLRMQALRQRGQRASGVGHVRGIVPGCTFALTEYPQEKANAEYIVLGTRVVIENVGEDAQRPGSNNALDAGHFAQLSGSTGSSIARGAGLMRGTAKSANTPGDAAALAGDAGGFTASGTAGGFAGGIAGAVVALSDAKRLTGQWRVHVAFDVQPTTEALRPAVTQPKPKTGGPETALVVGPSADTAESNIYTDTLGRIKVQFHWDRYGGKNQNSSCWVRVAHPWAGNQLGAMHIPRIGQEVLVDFLGGDPDMPIVEGSIHNAANMAPWSLPDQQALSGFRSRELTPGGGNGAAGRSNHLILDDTEHKIQAQLKSDHQHSSLSLGHITRIEDNQGRKDPLGEGFELRTDGHGVIRAKDGLLISTEGRTKAQAHAKDMAETTQRLSQAQDQHAQLGDLAKQMQAQDPSDQGDVAKALKDQNDAIEGKKQAAGRGADASGSKAGAGSTSSTNDQFPELADPHLVLSSPAGIASTTSGSTHQHSNHHHAITSAQHTSISAAKSVLVTARKAVRIYLRKLGVRMVAWGGDIEITAVEQGVHFLANVNITETADTIEFHAKKQLELGGGSSYSVLNKAGINHNTAGEFVVHSATTHMDGAKSMTVPELPAGQQALNEMFVLKDKKGNPVTNFPYRVEVAGGRVVRSFTNAKGESVRTGTGSSAKGMVIAPDVE